MSQQRTILLVDELAWFRELGSLFLARSGRVITAASADEALTLARLERPNLVVTDLGMPGRDGADLCRAIREDPEIHATPVIVIMGSSDPADHARAIRAGATDLLTKPITRYALLESVSRLTRSGRPEGRPRVPLHEPVRLRIAEWNGWEEWGTLRNLSRGGVFLEAPTAIEDTIEVALDFRLPGSHQPVRPTAQVMWSEPPRAQDGAFGLGMRFLALDGPSIHALEEFVFDNAVDHGLSHAGALP